MKKLNGHGTSLRCVAASQFEIPTTQKAHRQIKLAIMSMIVEAPELKSKIVSLKQRATELRGYL